MFGFKKAVTYFVTAVDKDLSGFTPIITGKQYILINFQTMAGELVGGDKVIWAINSNGLKNFPNVALVGGYYKAHTAVDFENVTPREFRDVVRFGLCGNRKYGLMLNGICGVSFEFKPNYSQGKDLMNSGEVGAYLLIPKVNAYRPKVEYWYKDGSRISLSIKLGNSSSQEAVKLSVVLYNDHYSVAGLKNTKTGNTMFKYCDGKKLLKDMEKVEG